MAGLRPYFEEGLRPGDILERIGSEGPPAWRESLEKTHQIFNPEREIERAENLGVEIIPFTDSRYPSLLRESSDPPFVLYMKGSLLESDEAAVALVGTRHPSLYGREQARRFSSELARMGLTIISGFARGIDRFAHEAALEVPYGRTVAVLGSGLDVIYPKEHDALFEEIAERGALVSEFALGTPPLAENFPKRNRIIAGLSWGTLVIEAHSRSGSLITARLAAEEGREVFALPGRVDQLGSRGTHRLLKEGAALVESPEEILEALSPRLWPSLHASASPLQELDDQEKAVLALFNDEPLLLEELIKAGHLPVFLAIPLLTRLELKGLLHKRLDGRYERVPAHSGRLI